jgi:hypothetical protein
MGRPAKHREYAHKECGSPTSIGEEFREFEARNLRFRDRELHYCSNCKEMFPPNEFMWSDDGTDVVG